MATYTYVCEQGDEETHSHGMREEPLIVCSMCGGPMRIKVRSAPAISVPDRTGYHPGLALRAGDPTAYVSSERDLRRVIDDRKRKGFEPMGRDD